MHETLLSPFLPVRGPDGWNAFLEDTAPLRLEDGVPFVFVSGNHDLYHRFDRETVARIGGDPAGPGGRDPDALWWSVDRGGFRLLVLDAGDGLLGGADPLAEGSPQCLWLEERLADADARGLVPVVALHYPPLSSGAEDPPDPGLARVLLEGVLDRHRVPLLLCGHCHGYERIERARPGGGTTTLLVTGGAGAPFHHEAEEGERAPGSRTFVEGTLHFVLLEAGADGIRGRALAAEDGRVLDEFAIPPR